MSEQQGNDNQETEASPAGPSGPSGDSGSTADGYIAHVRRVLTEPDMFFGADYRDDRGQALIDLGIFLIAVFLAAVIARVTGYSGWDFEFGYVIDAIKQVLTIGIPIGAAIFALDSFGKRSGNRRSIDFYLEKFGAGLILPALLLLGALVLDLLDIRIHSWFRGLSMAFIYALVFGLAYAYAAPGKLKIAAAFLTGFYLIYRLIALLF